MGSNVHKLTQGINETRTEYLMRVAAAVLRNNAYSIDTIHYDDAECDALCLAADLESELKYSTLIAEHKLMREALEEILRKPSNCSDEIATNALKQLSDGK